MTAAGVPALKNVRVATIGPVTSNAAHIQGIPVDVEAYPYTIDGLVNAILRLF